MEKTKNLKEVFAETAKGLHSKGVQYEELSTLLCKSINNSEQKSLTSMFAPCGIEDPSDGMIYPLTSD
ncbi:MAG: hypothetical protein A3F72_02530 [Bacteroidetes bacterium RIFCSPLOWO2_12_FULL_35_15]|nr:MAG: hypothetical protein A3F72_02530 [Bacteroidetes bacterium RIFCSPLOWO2_12_FULL_35_15]